jgi:hypothetical protein
VLLKKQAVSITCWLIIVDLAVKTEAEIALCNINKLLLQLKPAQKNRTEIAQLNLKINIQNSAALTRSCKSE